MGYFKKTFSKEKIKVLTKEFLEKEYIINKKSINIIAKEIGCCNATIFNHLKKFNIPRRTISESGIGRKMSVEFKQLMSKLQTGVNNSFFGKKHSEKSKQKISEHYVGMTGQHHTEESKKKIRLTKIGMKLSEDHKKKISLNHARAFKGKHHTEETKLKISLKAKERFKDPRNHPNYIDGKNVRIDKYSDEFNEELRETIRKDDNYICQNCGMTEEEHLIVYGAILCVHHIDYDKKNSNKNNLITLCYSCHMRTNYNRNYWQEVFNKRKSNVILPPT
jgi:hypothetical protein